MRLNLEQILELAMLMKAFDEIDVHVGEHVHVNGPIFLSDAEDERIGELVRSDDFWWLEVG